ncbi:MAG: hypothetical protein IJ391_02705 [Clostridia bacterium]|nr:hypothetical protein [Clostridia bacterium]
MIYDSLALFSESAPSGDEKDIPESYPADAAQTDAPELDQAVTEAAEAVTGTGGQVSPDAAEGQSLHKTRREVYDEFIRAHKDLFTEDTQKIISRRFKEVKETEEALLAARAEIKSLSDRLTETILTPCPPDADFLASHPDFSLERELENDIFRLLYNGGVAFDTAFAAAHADEITNAAVKEAVKATLDSIRSRGTRSRESAANASPGTSLRRDVSKLTKNERADIARRAMAGEEINFY